MSKSQKQTTTPPELQTVSGVVGIGDMKISDRNVAYHLVLPDLNYELQLVAIRELLAQHREIDEALRKEIEALAKMKSGSWNEHAIDTWMERLEHSVYQDAALSMSAVGLIAPFIESIFYQAFQGIGRQMMEGVSPPSNHGRWQRPAQDQWDCHFVWTKGQRNQDLVLGIMQLADAIYMSKHLPRDLRQTLKALFHYRNKMFHCGFEWPVKERDNFQKRITESEWPSDWFTKSTDDDEPWLFYMSETFIQHCLETVDKIITGIGAFYTEKFLSVSRPQEDAS